MKPARFDYRRAKTPADAAALLTSTADAKILAGGQSLGPMLNLRLARPGLLVDLTKMPELKRISDEGSRLSIGAAVTHAMIEDGAVPPEAGPAAAMLQSVAGGIAYRAIRTRGTVGGSLAHADPAADWMTALIALDATVVLLGAKKTRAVPIARFMLGAFATALGPDEIIESVLVPKLSGNARWGYYKVWRKTGEFAHALAAVVADP
ncbi:MAG: carbon monoxide dehydrogenase, partial [Alphaproteobacteria bacterium]|nr:carbon monoxide dehydrogenase [Alphaproteobacteria bacterium]